MNFFGLFRPSLKDSFWNSATDGGRYGSDIPFVQDIQSDLPAFSDLPGRMQGFLQSLDGLPKYEQMQLIHRFVNDNMDYPTNMDDIFDGDRILSNEEVIKNWRYGDCDNIAQLSASLMRYAGFEEQDLFFVGGEFSYGEETGLPHAVAFIHIDGEYYLMDMNVYDVIPVHDNDDGSFSASARVNGNPNTTINIDPMYVVPIDKDQPAIFDVDKMREVEANMPENNAQPPNAEIAIGPLQPSSGI